MKTLLFIFLFTFSNDTTRYEKAMLENIEAISKAETKDDLQGIINIFDRIAAKETDKWEPHYYSAYCHVLMALRETESARKDTHLDMALELINKAYNKFPNESELVAMEGFIHMIRVTVDPATRGQQYAGLSMKAFQKALDMNPENPRALYLMAEMEMGTASFFGSDTAPACEKLQKSIEKFDSESTANLLAPKWGKKHALRTLENCKN